MAGSLLHLVGNDGKFTMDLIGSGTGDDWEALHECYQIIIELSGGDMEAINNACKKLNTCTIDIQMRPSAIGDSEND